MVAYLAGFVTEHRRQRIEQVLSQRTRYLTIALEDIYQPHNASAVLRSCECFGVQDVHIVENKNTYEVNRDVTQGASKWLTLIRYNKKGGDNTRICIEALRSRGYRIVAATPHQDDCLLDELPVEDRMAVVFGTEELGLTEYVLEQADEYVKVPMYGFTKSFNISVSAALVLREFTRRMRASDAAWELTQEEKLDLRLSWYRKVVRGSDLLERKFLLERGEQSIPR